MSRSYDFSSTPFSKLISRTPFSNFEHADNYFDDGGLETIFFDDAVIEMSYFEDGVFDFEYGVFDFENGVVDFGHAVLDFEDAVKFRGYGPFGQP